MNFKDSDEISQKIKSDILNNRPASIADVKSLTDLKLSQISWIFDFNFIHSIKQAKKRKHIQTIFSTIPFSKEKDKCQKKVSDFMEPF